MTLTSAGRGAAAGIARLHAERAEYSGIGNVRRGTLSDDIDPRWSHTPTDFLLRLPPFLLAAAITHRHRRSRDHATVPTACSQQVTS